MTDSDNAGPITGHKTGESAGQGAGHDAGQAHDWNTPPPDQDWSKELRGLFRSRLARYCVIGLFLVLAIRFGLTYLDREAISTIAPEVHAVHPVMKVLDPNISLPANLEAIQQASLYAHVSGYLKKIYVDEGDTVKKGQLLADIDAPDVIDEYNRLRSEMKLRKITKERNQELLKGNVISQQEFDTVATAADEAVARFQNAAENVDYTKVRASFDGSIARRYKYPGDLINASDKTPIFLLVNESELRVVVNIPQVDVSAVQIGNQVDIKVDAFARETFHGTVSRLDALLDEQTKTQRILIDLSNPDKKLHAGMFATVILHFSHAGPAMTIPAEAVHLDADGKATVFVDVKNKATLRSIELGSKNGDTFEIKSGLQTSDSVIISGITELTDGEAVKVLSSSK